MNCPEFCHRMMFLLILLSIFFSRPAYSQSRKAVVLYEEGLKALEGDYAVKAVVKFTDAIALEQTYADAYDMRGRTFLGMGRMDPAVRDFKLALKYDPTLVTPAVRLYNYYFDQQEYDAAMEMASHLMEHHPKQEASALDLRSKVYEAKGDHPNAIKMLEKAITLLESATDQAFIDYREGLKERVKALKNE